MGRTWVDVKHKADLYLRKSTLAAIEKKEEKGPRADKGGPVSNPGQRAGCDHDREIQKETDAGETYKVKPSEPDDWLHGGGREAGVKPHLYFCLE